MHTVHKGCAVHAVEASTCNRITRVEFPGCGGWNRRTRRERVADGLEGTSWLWCGRGSKNGQRDTCKERDTRCVRDQGRGTEEIGGHGGRGGGWESEGSSLCLYPDQSYLCLSLFFLSSSIIFSPGLRLFVSESFSRKAHSSSCTWFTFLKQNPVWFA